MSLRPMDSEFKRLMTPSIALLVLAALTPDEHEVEIIDENVSPIKNYDSADLVGITSNVDTFDRARAISARFMKTGSPVIFGGIFPSSCPDIAQQYCNSVCIGDAESNWATILADAAGRRLQKRYIGRRELNVDLIPRPKWEAIDKKNYLYTNVVTTSRGCIHTCEFCYNSCEYIVREYRRRPLVSVIREIERLETKQVLFVDDNFLGDPKWLNEFLAVITPLNLTWHAAVSVEIGRSLPLMDKMARAGCRSLFIGFESINQSSVTGVRKRQNHVSEYETTIRELHDRQIMINASMVFGFDHDDAGVFDATLQWLLLNRVETMTAHILTPYPGTKLYARLEAEGRIIDKDLTHYNTAHVVFQPALMSREELLNGYLKIYDRFYSLKNIGRRFPRAREQWIPFILFNLGYRKFGSAISRIGKFGLMQFIGKAARKLSYGID